MRGFLQKVRPPDAVRRGKRIGNCRLRVGQPVSSTRLSVSNSNMDVDPELDHPTKVHDVLWYPDGDVVLATDSLLFKVHKFILSLQSSVFKDMFDPPNWRWYSNGWHRNRTGDV